jgi:hypothetical protein
MRKRILLFFLLIALITGCGRTEPLKKEEIQKFITDSENIYTVLETAYQEGRELDLDEKDEFISYTSKYDSESDFRSKTDDPSISLVVSSASLMELTIGKEDDKAKQEYKEYKSDFLEELNAVKEKVQSN